METKPSQKRVNLLIRIHPRNQGQQVKLLIFLGHPGLNFKCVPIVMVTTIGNLPPGVHKKIMTQLDNPITIAMYAYALGSQHARNASKNKDVQKHLKSRLIKVDKKITEYLGTQTRKIKSNQKKIKDKINRLNMTGLKRRKSKMSNRYKAINAAKSKQTKTRKGLKTVKKRLSDG